MNRMLSTALKPVSPGSVRLTDRDCVNALEKEVAYLLSLQEGRLLAGFYENAGIPTPFVRYGGWESGLIGGHTAGHFLTALSQAAVNPGIDAKTHAEVGKKIRGLVDGFAECQEHSRGRRGFLWGAPPVGDHVEAQFDFVEEGKTNILTQAWVPWYTLHKILAGLIDAYELTQNARALEVASALGDWVFERVSGWTPEVHAQVLSVEYGGMNDALYSLYAHTKKPEHAFAAHQFDEETLFDLILSEKRNGLKNRHANTTIPKILGSLNRYLVLHGTLLDGAPVDAVRYLRVAEIFWKTVIERHTYVTGGNSEWEHFREDYALDRNRTNCNCETCNVYNMLKLSRLLFCVTKDKKYADYYERAFTNSILSSQNPETGMSTYFQPMASGFFKVFTSPYDRFWCCTGSGMENFTKLGDSVFYEEGQDLYLEQYLSCELNAGGKRLRLRCDFPLSEEGNLVVERAEAAFCLFLRVPDWAKDGMTVAVNGVQTQAECVAGHLRIKLSAGDEVRFRIPCSISLSALPDAPDVVAFSFGGAVLSADLGSEEMEVAETGVNVLIPARKFCRTERIYFPDLAAARADPAALFRREGERFLLVGGDLPLVFGLHFHRYRERYAIYWKLCEGMRESEKEAREPFDIVQPGYGQYENDELHEMREQNSVSVTSDGTCRYAETGGWFSYDFSVLREGKNILSLELAAEDNGKPLRITADGEEIFCARLLYTQGEEHYRMELELPESVVKSARTKVLYGKEYAVVRIRFEGGEERSARIWEFLYLYAE